MDHLLTCLLCILRAVWCPLCKMSVMILCPSQSPLGVTNEKHERIRYCSGDFILKNLPVNFICCTLKNVFNFQLFKVLSLPYSLLKGNSTLKSGNHKAHFSSSVYGYTMVVTQYFTTEIINQILSAAFCLYQHYIL